MKESELQQVIDEYLLGTITPEQKEMLELKMRADPAVAQAFRESQLAFDAIRQARDNKRRTMLQKWDEDHAWVDTPKKRKGLWVVTGIAGWLIILVWGIWYFAPSQLSMRYADPATALPLHTSKEQRLVWEQALYHLEKKEIEKARSLFRTFGQNTNNPDDGMVKWNELMCELAAHGVTQGWIKEIEAISASAQGTHQEKADRMLRLVNSPFYRWIYTRLFRQSVYFIRPSII